MVLSEFPLFKNITLFSGERVHIMVGLLVCNGEELIPLRLCVFCVKFDVCERLVFLWRMLEGGGNGKC